MIVAALQVGRHSFMCDRMAVPRLGGVARSNLAAPHDNVCDLRNDKAVCTLLLRVC